MVVGERGRGKARFTAYCDEGTIERIHEQVPGAPVLAKPVCPQILADAVGALVQALTLIRKKAPAEADAQKISPTRLAPGL